MCDIRVGTWACYRFGPFSLRSEIDLKSLGLPEGVGGREVIIRRGSVNPVNPVNSTDPVGPMSSAGPAGHQVTPWVWAAPGTCLLDAVGVGRFLVEDGCRVMVDILAGAEERDVRGYLTAWVFGALCHQNGLLPLHACAVEKNGVVVAFLGDSGAGKSTLAAFLARRGGRVLADDICLLEDFGKQMQVVPVASWLKLWRGSLDALGLPAEALKQTYSDEDKFRLGLGAEAPAGMKLRRIAYLERGELSLEKASPVDMIGRMMNTTYLGYVVEALGITGRLFTQCGRVLDEADGYVLRTPLGWDRMEEVLDLVEAEFFKP